MYLAFPVQSVNCGFKLSDVAKPEISAAVCLPLAFHLRLIKSIYRVVLT
jgi:hypothetical protein